MLLLLLLLLRNLSYLPGIQDNSSWLFKPLAYHRRGIIFFLFKVFFLFFSSLPQPSLVRTGGRHLLLSSALFASIRPGSVAWHKRATGQWRTSSRVTSPSWGQSALISFEKFNHKIMICVLISLEKKKWAECEGGLKVKKKIKIKGMCQHVSEWATPEAHPRPRNQGHVQCTCASDIIIPRTKCNAIHNREDYTNQTPTC